VHVRVSVLSLFSFWLSLSHIRASSVSLARVLSLSHTCALFLFPCLFLPMFSLSCPLIFSHSVALPFSPALSLSLVHEHSFLPSLSKPLSVLICPVTLNLCISFAALYHFLALSCSVLLFLALSRYRVAKTHRIPYLYGSFSAKVTYI